MEIIGSDFLVVNRGGIDYKAPASGLGSIINDLFPEAPADGSTYARKGDTGTWVRALPYDISALDDLP